MPEVGASGVKLWCTEGGRWSRLPDSSSSRMGALTRLVEMLDLRE